MEKCVQALVFDNDDIYYLGDNGYAKTGWLCLDYDEDNKPDDGTISEIRTSASDTAKWFYFQTNGKAKRSKNDSYSAETIGVINIILMKTV